jgi:uncharacterized protein
MFGKYDMPLNIEKEGVSISIEKEGDAYSYSRECLEEKVKKTLLIGNGRLLINPVEPLNKPKSITPYLLIKFEKKLVVEPKATKKIFLTFPVEIAAFIAIENDFELLDVFTLTNMKFTLYGDSRNGFICKYWKSEVYSVMPTVDILQQGVIELSLTNSSATFTELTQAVFNAYGMKIFYSDGLTAMKATIKLRAGDIAETDFEDSPLENGMTRSLEVYTSKKLLVTSTKFLMEYGI